MAGTVVICFTDIVDSTAMLKRVGDDTFDSLRRSHFELLLREACPCESAAAADPGTICELHRGIAAGVAETAGGITVDELVVKDPRRAGCRLRCTVEATT